MTTARPLPGFGGRLLALDDGRDAAVLGVLTASSRRSRAALQNVTTRAIGLAGTRGLRRVEVPRDRIFGLEVPALTAAIAQVTPGAHIVGLSLPRQGGRRRVIALCRTDGAVVVAKIDADPSLVEHEARILEVLGGRTLPAVITPRLVGSGRADTPDGEVAIVVQTAVTTRPHSPVTTFDVDRLCDTIAEALESVLGPPPQPGWVPNHGDLAPWNLRRTDRGVALVDWETAAHAPLGTDAAYFAACATFLTSAAMPSIRLEARTHLLAMLDERSDAEDLALTTGLRDALHAAPTLADGHT
jgi:hypothetical protein